MSLSIRLLFALLAACVLGACATPAAISPYVGTYRATDGDTTLQVRVTADGQVDFFAPIDGTRTRGVATFDNAGGRGGFNGLLPDGEVFGFNGQGAAATLWIGARTFTLTPIPPSQFGVGAAPAAHGPAAGGGARGASLAGLRLSMARGGNGYFTERSYDLCSDGRVYTRWAESQLSQLGGAAGERTDHGTWQQSGSTLQLNLARAGRASFTVQRPEPRVVRLDGTAYAAEPSPRCR